MLYTKPHRDILCILVFHRNMASWTYRFCLLFLEGLQCVSPRQKLQAFWSAIWWRCFDFRTWRSASIPPCWSWGVKWVFGIAIKVTGGKHLLVGSYYLPFTIYTVEIGIVPLELSSFDLVTYGILILGYFNLPAAWWELQDTLNDQSKVLPLVNFFRINDFELGDPPANACGNVSDVFFTNMAQ